MSRARLLLAASGTGDPEFGAHLCLMRRQLGCPHSEHGLYAQRSALKFMGNRTLRCSAHTSSF